MRPALPGNAGGRARLSQLRSPTAALIALALLLAACNGGAPSLAAPDSTSTPASTAEATPAAPASATAPTGTAEAAARAFEEPDAERAFEHIRVLVEDIGSRVSATAAEREAATYIATQFEQAGYDVTIEPFDVETVVDESAVSADGVEVESVRAMSGSRDGEAEGRLVFGGLGSAADLADGDARGAVLLLDRGTVTFSDKARNAKGAGAVAVIVVNNEPGPLRGSLGDAGVDIPVVGVPQEAGDALRQVAEEGGAARVLVRLLRSVEQSQNVVARRGEQCTAYLGAHYDSVEAGPGANDNASGTAAIMELARTHRVDGLCAVAFGSEESGLWGSRAFVDQHDVGDARFLLNLDMVGKITAPAFMATDHGPSHDLAERAAGIAAGLGFEMPDGQFPSRASSDHASFAAAGVPAVTVHSGDDPLIHRPGDDLQNVSREDLARMLEVSAAVLRDLLGP